MKPAFPVIPPQDEHGLGSANGYPFPDEGMDLRDYFASHALYTVATYDTNPEVFEPKWIAERAYAVADAMMEAREAKP